MSFRICLSIRLILAIVSVLTFLFGTSLSVFAQDSTYPPGKSSPPRVAEEFIVVPESLVQNQSAHTLNLMNAPANVALLNPGQCIRVAIYAIGDNRDDYLKKAKVSYSVQFAGRTDTYPMSYPSILKQIKPEGGDFVNSALTAAGVKVPPEAKTMASLGISSDHWCSPIGANDGNARIEAEVESANGRQKLKPSMVQVQSFDTGSKNTFKNIDEFGSFLMTYYRQPNPARLLPALQFLVAEQTQHSRAGQTEIASAFLSAALRSDPIAAKDFRARVVTQAPMTRVLGLLVLRSAGYDISEIVGSMSAEEQADFASLPELQNPFDMTPTQELFQHLDMMWAVFGATGELKPVETLAGTLAWRSDYDAFEKLRKSGDHPSSVTPSLVRGIVYMAAGWSVRSNQKNDPLVADYIDYLLASASTPEAVKTELRGLWNNPAFQRGQK